MNKTKLRNDILLTAALLLLAAAGLLLLFLTRTSGAYAVVTVDGEETARYSLSQNITVPIYTGENESQYNVLVIKDGAAYVSEASCPDKICAHHRAISYVGETIICLPNRMAIIIDGAGKGVDIVS